MKKSKKIAKLNVHELEKRVAPASAAGIAHSQGSLNASLNGLINSQHSDGKSVLFAKEDPYGR